MPPPDPASIARHVSDETGLHFEGRAGRLHDGNHWIELTPAEHRAAETFTIRTTIGWRRLDVRFQLGSFAVDLLAQISRPDETGRALFQAVLEECERDKAAVELTINDDVHDFRDPKIWSLEWERAELHVRRGMLAVNVGDGVEDERLIRIWMSRMAAAVIAILPLENVAEDFPEPDFEGLPEGAKVRVEVNRYERDRRNRAAALAIHGYVCKACEMDMAAHYGEAAIGLIEVHHVTPVSMLGPNYRINPAVDLVPLCPNCHSVVHRRCPPFSIDELKAMMAAVPGVEDN